jgi:hypothetical protein
MAAAPAKVLLITAGKYGAEFPHFILQLLKRIFQAGGGKSNVVQALSMFFQALEQR